MLRQFSDEECAQLNRDFDRDFYFDEDGYQCDRIPIIARPMTARRSTPRRTRRSSYASSGATSGGAKSSDPDPAQDPDRPLQLFDTGKLADLLCISPKTLQNLYSKSPHDLPMAVAIPGARGPRWTMAAIRAWLDARPSHTSAHPPRPDPPKKPVGRPRIANMRDGK